MTHVYSEEFDIYEVYQKLTEKSIPKVRACDFFQYGNELKRLQRELNTLSKMRHATMYRSTK